MYSTCIHCQRDLGRNAVIETLPIGRRIAFDEATGRLWVVCTSCARWNLVPFESRWEAIEAGEKLYRGTSQRMSTGEIGLAKTREGMELVRIGKPLRPEMAAWRYGAQLVQRRWTYAKASIPLGLAIIGLPNAHAIMSLLNARNLAIPFVGQVLYFALLRRFVMSRTQACLSTRDGPVVFTLKTAASVRVQPAMHGGMSIWLPIVEQPIEDVSLLRLLGAPLLAVGQHLHPFREVLGSVRVDAPSHFRMLRDEDLLPALRSITLVMNQAGASQRKVTEATEILRQPAPNTASILYENPEESLADGRLMFLNVPAPRRLALEMFVHEDSERRWLASDLLDLEQEWRRADEIAAIADGLLHDPAIEAKLTALRDSQPRAKASDG